MHSPPRLQHAALMTSTLLSKVLAAPNVKVRPPRCHHVQCTFRPLCA
jgi:hypothetical protein